MYRSHRPLKDAEKGNIILIIRAVTMIDPVTGWCEITHYSDKKATKIVN